MTLSSRQVIISPKIMLSVAHGNASDPSPEHLSTIETNRFVDTIGMVKDEQIHCQISGCGNGEYARHWAYAHSNIESYRIGVLISVENIVRKFQEHATPFQPQFWWLFQWNVVNATDIDRIYAFISVQWQHKAQSPTDKMRLQDCTMYIANPLLHGFLTFVWICVELLAHIKQSGITNGRIEEQ